MDHQLFHNVNKNILPESVTGLFRRCGQFRSQLQPGRVFLWAGGGLLLALSLPVQSLGAEPDPNAPWPAAEKKGLRPKSSVATPPAATPKPSTPAPAPAPVPAPAAVPAAAPAAVAAAASAVPADFRQVPKINGIVIVPSLKDLNPDGVPLRPGLTVPPKSLLRTSEFAKVARWYMNQPLNEAQMRALQREIILYYRRHDRPLVDVLYPDQDVSNGMLQIIVIEGRLKSVKVQDSQGNPYTNGWSGVKHLQQGMRTRVDSPIAESAVARDLDWLNRNPLRRVEAVFEPDPRDYGYTSILLRTEEQRQWSVSFGYEDSGTILTDENRITAGVLWAKAFGQPDHLLRYDFTANPGFDALRAHTASYFLPLPWRHGLRFSGYYLEVAGDVDENVRLEGEAYQASFRYEVPLPAIGKYQHEVSAGLDFKYNENNLLFGESGGQNTPTEIFQFAGGYSALLPDSLGQTALSIQAYYSPGDVTDLNTDRFFNFSRPFAQAEYLYGRFNLERTTRLPADFSWIMRGIIQVADGNLLPSEQLGMGGYATVRGYSEREGNGDRGYFFSTELRTPPVSLSHYFTNKPLKGEGLQLLGFWDWGQIENVDLRSDEDPHVVFSSVGVGLRYSLTRHFSLRFDYGWQLVDSYLETAPDYNSRAHIGVTATY